MAKKLVGNGVFESSRMILPEYRDAYLEQQERKLEREKPALDPQELELIHRAIIDARNQRLKLRVTKFGPYEDEVFVGMVSTIFVHRNEFKLLIGEDDWVFINIADIISATID